MKKREKKKRWDLKIFKSSRLRAYYKVIFHFIDHILSAAIIFFGCIENIWTFTYWSGAKIIIVTPTIHFSNDSISTQSQSWTQEVMLLTEQNNNSPEPNSMFKHLETLETIIIDILEPKDPPKKIMRIDNGYRNRWLSSQSPQSLTIWTLSSISVIITLWFRHEHKALHFISLCPWSCSQTNKLLI